MCSVFLSLHIDILASKYNINKAYYCHLLLLSVVITVIKLLNTNFLMSIFILVVRLIR